MVFFSQTFERYFWQVLNVICFGGSILVFAVPNHVHKLWNNLPILIPFINSLFIALYYFITPCLKEWYFFWEFLRGWVVLACNFILFLLQYIQHMLFISIVSDISLFPFFSALEKELCKIHFFGCVFSSAYLSSKRRSSFWA